MLTSRPTLVRPVSWHPSAQSRSGRARQAQWRAQPEVEAGKASAESQPRHNYEPHTYRHSRHPLTPLFGRRISVHPLAVANRCRSCGGRVKINRLARSNPPVVDPSRALDDPAEHERRAEREQESSPRPALERGCGCTRRFRRSRSLPCGHPG
jgi:hypothetical protein